jgi:serine/threonine-protein kinase
MAPRVVTGPRESVVIIGQTFSHYRILEKLGEGGMGLVYKAEDTRLRRPVALKILPRELTFNEEAKGRFLREAQAASTLDHPNVCTIYEADQTADGISFIAMAWCDGEPLTQRLQRGPMGLEEALDTAIQVGSGLMKAHGAGIVHRDLKPANVMLTREGQAKIVDFGLAKLRGGTRVTRANTTLGTIEYMSPEQARGEEVDQRTDIWSLGCLLYEMFTGRTPFKGEYEQAVIYSILNTPPQPITALRSGIPLELERIVMKALEKDREDRYHNAGDLIVDLRRVQRSIGGETRPPPPRGKVSDLRIRAYTAALAFIVIAVGVAIIIDPFPSDVSKDRKSVAVLPFANLTGDAEEDYFSDGITDDILTQLCKIGDLRVISRTTMQQYRNTDKSVREIGAELNAGAVLEGSVRRAGDRVRIVAQLIDAGSDDHLWAETYDRNIEDILEVQTEIARRIADALQATLSEAESQRLRSPPSVNPEAYNLVLEGGYYLVRGTRKDVDEAISKFRQALAIDPGSARAWASLATAYARQADLGALSTEEGYARAREAAVKALELDSQLAQGHTIMGWIKRSYDWDWTGAETECRKALELAPGDVSVIRNMANLQKSLGRFDEAILLMERASELDPKKAPIHTSLGLLSMYAGRLGAASAAYRKAIELNPEYPAAHTFLGLVLLLQGKTDEAISSIQSETDEGWKLYGLAQAFHGAGRAAEADSALKLLIIRYGKESTYQVAQAYAFRGEVDSAFVWLERAYAARDAGLSEFKGDPFMRNLEPDRRYSTLMKKLKLPA